jgi:molybdopterin-binding protein
MSLLSAEGLVRRYGGRRVVDLDHLAVEPGEIVAILGPNGAGKSTLFRLLLLLESPDAGRLSLSGREIRPGDREAERRMAGVFQRPFLFSGTVADNVAYGLRIRGVARGERERRAAEALEAVGLSRLAHRNASALSGGEAQRVALARALVLRPELLLLDEPTSSLDVTVKRRFREDLQRLVRARAGGTILITHDPADAFTLADRIAVMERGRIVQVGSPDALVVEPATPFIAAFTGAELLLDGVVAERAERLLHVRLHGAAGVMTALAPAEGDPPEAGEPVHLAYRPEDVVLSAPDASGETSARNRFSLRIIQLAPAGGLVRVRLEGEISLVALITRQAADSLALAVGVEVVAQLKATALRAFRGAVGARTGTVAAGREEGGRPRRPAGHST